MAVDIFARTVALASLNGSEGSYTKAEIDKMFGEAGTVQVEAVDVLPTENIKENVIYLVPNGSSGENYYDECMYINGKWEVIGTTEIDLSNYYTKDEVDNRSIFNIALPNSTLEGSSGNIRQEDYQAFLPLLQFLYTKCRGTSGSRFIRLPLVNINTAHDSSNWIDLDNSQLFVVYESYNKAGNVIYVTLEGIPKFDQNGAAKYFRLEVNGNIENDNITSIVSVRISKSTIPLATEKYVDDSKNYVGEHKFLILDDIYSFSKEYFDSVLLPAVKSVGWEKVVVILSNSIGYNAMGLYMFHQKIESTDEDGNAIQTIIFETIHPNIWEQYKGYYTSGSMLIEPTITQIVLTITNDEFANATFNYKRSGSGPRLNLLPIDEDAKNAPKVFIPTYDAEPATKKYVDDNKYSLPIASADTLGGIKLGKGLSADENGVVSADVKNSSKTITLTGSYYITGGNNDSYLDLSTDDCASIGSFILETGVKYGDDDKSKLYEASYYIKECNAVIKPFNVSIYTNNLAGVNTYSYQFNCYFISRDSSYMTGNGNDTTIKIVSFNVNLHSETFEPIRGQITWGQIKGYLSKSNTSSYTPTSDYHPATKKYVDDSSNNVTKNVNNTLSVLPQNLIDNGFYYDTHQIEEIPVNHTIENISMAYEFELNENGYYESNNKGSSNSYSLCQVTFNNEQPLNITISYINSGESNYDYGIFSNIDKELSRDNSDDGNTGSEKVFKNCKGESSTDVKEIVYKIPAGEHFIQIKYRKDGGGDSDNDSLQFKIPSVISQEVYENRKIATTKYVDDAVEKDAIILEVYFPNRTDVTLNTQENRDKLNIWFNDILNKGYYRPLYINSGATEGNLKMSFTTNRYLYRVLMIEGFPLNNTSREFSFYCLPTFNRMSVNTEFGVQYRQASQLETKVYLNWGDNGEFLGVSSVNWSGSKIYLPVYDSNTKHLPLGVGNTTAYTPTGDYNPATKKYVDDSITTAIAGVTQFSLVPVDALPTENIRTDAIYAIPSDNPQEQDVRIEYVYINDSWEKLGNTKIDLSNYYTKAEIDTKLEELHNLINTNTTVATSEEVTNILNGTTTNGEVTE